jgi:N6-L-threonylcarbamoyladenine synthase
MPAEESARLLLAIETTCDETAAALISERLEVLASVVASQEELHERFKGVVPEIAARAHLEKLLPTIDLTLSRAGKTLDDVDLIAVAHTPGLAGSLLVGVVAAKTLAFAIDKPLVAINHLHGHIYACQLAAGRNVFPCVGLIVSGGHSSLYRCSGPTEFEYLGGTIDDAAGEAFDKAAAMLGLPYPGGPAISRAAEKGNPAAYQFPRPLIHDKSRLDFSFSGLKTALRYALVGAGNPEFPQVALSPQQQADLAASFQEAVVDCLVNKAMLALKKTRGKTLCVGGGVAANRLLRERLATACSERNIELHIAPPDLCTDNAVMGSIAWEMFRAGKLAPDDLDVLPGLVRGPRS